MGIVGFGGTGRAIARRAAAFGMECIAVDNHDVEASPEVHEVWGTDRFDELLARSHVVASGMVRDMSLRHRGSIRFASQFCFRLRSLPRR